MILDFLRRILAAVQLPFKAVVDWRRRKFSLDAISRKAAARLPILEEEITSLVRRVDPRELLSQLTLLYQTHRSDKPIETEELARWQVRIEWLVWLVAYHRMQPPPEPEFIDARILWPLEDKLDEYFQAASMSVLGGHNGASDEERQMRSLLLLEALHVRGEGFPQQIEYLARQLFSPHDDWCRQRLGFTVDEALLIARRVFAVFEHNVERLRAAGRRVEDTVRANPSEGIESVHFPESIRSSLQNALASGMSTEEAARHASFIGDHQFQAALLDQIGQWP